MIITRDVVFNEKEFYNVQEEKGISIGIQEKKKLVTNIEEDVVEAMQAQEDALKELGFELEDPPTEQTEQPTVIENGQRLGGDAAASLEVSRSNLAVRQRETGNPGTAKNSDFPGLYTPEQTPEHGAPYSDPHGDRHGNTEPAAIELSGSNRQVGDS